MTETLITEDFFKELHDDYTSIKDYLKKAKTEHIKEVEADESHAKAKETADKMILAAENAMKTIDVDNKYYYRLLGIRSSIMCEKSKLLTMSKLPEDAEGVLSAALNYLLDGALKPEISFIILRIINHFAYVLSVCERYEEARLMLEQGEKIYEMLKGDVGPDKTPSFYTGDDLFEASLEMAARPETNEQVENLVTNSIQMLGHVYNKQGRDDKFAEYQHRALERQLMTREGDALNWSVKAGRLANHFISKGMFREARTHLAAASQVLETYEIDLKSEFPDEDVTAKMNETRMRMANLGRTWVKYAHKLVTVSKQKLIADYCGDPVQQADDMIVEESEVESEIDEQSPDTEEDEEEATEPTSAPEEPPKEGDELFPEVVEPVEPVSDVPREDGDKAEVKEEEEDKEGGDVGKEKGDGEEVVKESGEGVKEKKEEEEKEGEEKAEKKEEVVGDCGEGIQLKEVVTENAKNLETAPSETKPADLDSVPLGEGISKIDIINNKILSDETKHNEEDELLPRRASGNNIPIRLTDIDFTFPTLDLSDYEAAVPCDLITQADVARKFFAFLHSWQKLVITYYNPGDYPNEYLAAAMDIIDVIRMMAFFETDIDMMYSVHKARYDGLEALCEVLNKVHPEHFLSASVDLFRELADVQLEMMGLNLRRLFMVTSEKKLAEDEEEEEEEEELEGMDQGVDTRDLGLEPADDEDGTEEDAKSEKEEGEIDEEDDDVTMKEETSVEDSKLDVTVAGNEETAVVAEEVDGVIVNEEKSPENESDIIHLNKSPAVEDLVAKLDSV